MKKNTLNSFNMEDKVVVLTGSAGRIGKQFSHALSSAGANVVLVDLETDKNQELEKTLKKSYCTNPSSFTIDITNEKQVKKLKQQILKKYKKIDVLINNAHHSPRTDPNRDNEFENFPLYLWEKTVNANLKSIFLCSKEIGKVMTKQKNGVIVNISSIYGLLGPDQKIYGKTKLNSPAHYATVKGGIVNLTRYLASHWGKKNIRVNTLTLGGMYDSVLHKNKNFVKKYGEKTILGRMGQKDDYDGALLFLVSDASNYMTGANLIVDGGWTAW